MLGPMIRKFAIGVLCCAAGCAGMLADDRRHLAEGDHAACAEGGHEWPSDAYKACRYALDEQRHQRDWRNLQLTRMPRVDQGRELPPEPYRALSRAEYRCTERPADDGGQWIDCDVER